MTKKAVFTNLAETGRVIPHLKDIRVYMSNITFLSKYNRIVINDVISPKIVSKSQYFTYITQKVIPHLKGIRVYMSNIT